MLLIPRCECGGVLTGLSDARLSEYVRRLLSAMSIASSEIPVAVAAEKVRLRLRCEDCSSNYVIASNANLRAMVCECGHKMSRADKSYEHTTMAWIESRWICDPCGMVDVRTMLERGDVTLFTCIEGMLTAKRTRENLSR